MRTESSLYAGSSPVGTISKMFVLPCIYTNFNPPGTSRLIYLKCAGMIVYTQKPLFVATANESLFWLNETLFTISFTSC